MQMILIFLYGFAILSFLCPGFDMYQSEMWERNKSFLMISNDCSITFANSISKRGIVGVSHIVITY